jgi:post-segregation antitoxin (ccd killing protein)
MTNVAQWVYNRRMPRMQVYLPEELHRAVKELGLPASELLQDAIRAELDRRRALDESDRYIAELLAEVGEPGREAKARAEALVQRIRKRRPRTAS